MAKKRKKYWLLSIAILLALLFFTLWYFKAFFMYHVPFTAGEDSGKQAVIRNYGKEILKHSSDFGIAPEYAAALCLMESGGRKPAPCRFEKHVYGKLKALQLGLISNYEHVTPEMIENAGDEALQNLASSWGPFQLMGYKCLLYDIKVKHLRGEDAVYWGLKWMHEAYGTYLNKGDFESAFHIHNAGVPFPKNKRPKTYHAAYVPDGIKWMQWYRVNWLGKPGER